MTTSTPTASLIGSGTERSSGLVVLATAIIYIQDSGGQWQPIRAILDSGSQMNFITLSKVQSLRLKRTKVNSGFEGIGEMSGMIRYKTQAIIKSRLTNYQTELEFMLLPSITSAQPGERINIKDWKLPPPSQLADPSFHLPSQVDMLLGAELYLDLLESGQIKLGEGLPNMQKTVFGWVVSGHDRRNALPYLSCNLSTDRQQTDADFELNDLVAKFWSIERIEVKTPQWTEEEAECERIFVENVYRMPDGRYRVKLPFKMDPALLGESRCIAERRFFNLEKRLNRNPALKLQYLDFLREYEQLGHMEVVNHADLHLVRYYTPHQCIIRPESSSTKLRVVFDCSCKTASQYSLNDILMKGPVVQNDIFSIVIRFRCYKYALTADISKMYRQVLVNENDAYYQCIVWRENPEEKLQTYKLKTVTYGTTSAPYLATRCLNHLATQNSNLYPEAAKVIQNDFYIDDLITGANSREGIDQIKREVCTILSSANFELRKWYSNDMSVLGTIEPSAREKLLRINDSDVIKTLGVVWEPVADKFRFVVPTFSDSDQPTKRSVLSEMARLFDPLGLINPVVVKAKIFMQDLWLMKLDWDQLLPIHLQNAWRNYKKQLTRLNEINIPRHVLPFATSDQIELHGFADASERAYGCCIYLRSIDSGGAVSVKLLGAKSRVAPLKSQSLPRLELCAAVLLVELLQKIKDVLPEQVKDTYLWTDSKVVMDWLSVHPSQWSTFVANRVSKIQESSATAWKHVSSKSNPADIVSRGATVEQLLNSCWFTGPSFLYEAKENWPKTVHRELPEEAPERKAVKVSLLTTTSTRFAELYSNSSNFEKTCRIFAYTLRFIKLLRKKSEEIERRSMPSARELDSALMHIVYNIQQVAFGEESAALARGKQISPRSSIKKLNPFLDVTSGVKLIRVGGRLQNANIAFDMKCPILLPKCHPFIKLYVNHMHFRNYHAGPQALVAIVRQRFWVINARDLCRSVVHQCLHCFKYRPKLKGQIMGDLPAARVNIARPFVNCGVDFCGPIYTSHRIRGRGPYKSYIAVFVCFATKAAHLEVVSELSSDAFLAALKRFVARRGRCQNLFCDNGTNFVGARRKLVELRDKFLQQQTQDQIASWCASSGIEFHHIPPRAPHFGGLWEAAVKSAKGHLYRTLGNTLLTFEELTTVTAEIEAVINSRPITALSTDPNDLEALTPGHFLVGTPLNCIIEPALDDTPEKWSRLQRWHRLKAIQQHFWRRWSSEYLLGLQTRYKWNKSSPDICAGTLVMIAEDNAPPLQWLIGRVVDVSRGRDGHVRVVDIKTKNGVIRRPIHRVAPLPVDN